MKKINIKKIIKEEINLLILEQETSKIKKKKKPDLNDIIDDLGLDPSPEEIKMLDRVLQGSPEDLEKLPPELKGILSQPDDPGEADDFLKSLDKSDADKAEKEKVEKARQAAIKLLVDNPQEPVQLSVEGATTSDILKAIKSWDPFPGLLPEDTPPEAQKVRAQSLQKLMLSLKGIFELTIRKEAAYVDKRFGQTYSKSALDYWIKNGRKMYDHLIPHSEYGRSGFTDRRYMKLDGERIPAKEIKAGKLSFMRNYGLSKHILHGFKKSFSIVGRSGPYTISGRNVTQDPFAKQAAPASAALVSYCYFQAIYPKMALKNSILDGFDIQKDKHLIGSSNHYYADGATSSKRRAHTQKEWKPKNRFSKKTVFDEPITFEELEKTIQTWKSSIAKFATADKEAFKSNQKGRVTWYRANKIGEDFVDPRDPYKSPEEKKKVEKAKKKGEWGFGDQLKYYLRLIDQADEITGGAIKRNVYMGTEPSKGSEPFTGSQPKPGPPRIEESELINIINQELQSVIGEKK